LKTNGKIKVGVLIALVLYAVSLLLLNGLGAVKAADPASAIKTQEESPDVEATVSPTPSGLPSSPSPSPSPMVEAPPKLIILPGASPAPSPKVKTIPPLSPEEKKRRIKNCKELGNKIRNIVNNDPAWKVARVGIYVQTLDRGHLIYEKNSNLPMIPASNLKVITSSAALSLLGPNYRFETSVWGGPVDQDGVMQGNIYLKGTGDPTFMKPFYDNSTRVFHEFARVLKKKGIRVIDGDVVGDDSAFDREFLGRGWKSRYLMYEYAAPAGALSINGNCVRLVISGGMVSMLPGNDYVQVAYNSSGGSISVRRKLGTDRIRVKGYTSRTAYRNITINNPSMFTTSVFAKVLKAHGIRITGKSRLIRDDELGYAEQRKKIVYHRSPPLHKIVYEINKESDNVCAQHVFKAIGYEVLGKGTCDNANQAIKDWMKKSGINPAGLAMADGSGLSVYNRVTPRLMCQILSYMTRHQYWDYFWKSLPQGGKDGTLEERMYGIPVKAKTGGLRGHIALSGYVRTKKGQLVVFSMLTNQHQHWGDRIRRNEDDVVKLIAAYNKKL